MSTFKIVSVNRSAKKGEKKIPTASIVLRAGHGVEGDAHAGDWHRQVSLLAMEDIETMKAKGLNVSCGDFAENLTTLGIDLPALPIGEKLTIGEAVIEITQIGKVCHDRCEIFRQAGDCVMPRRGVFGKVLQGGEVSHASVGSYGL